MRTVLILSLALIITGSCKQSHLSFVRTKTADPAKPELSGKQPSLDQDVALLHPFDSISSQADTNTVVLKASVSPLKSGARKKINRTREKIMAGAKPKMITNETPRRKYANNSIVAFTAFLLGGISIWCLAFGFIWGSVFWLIFFMGMIVALYFGFRALRDIKENPELKGKWLAAIACYGAIAVCLFLILLVFLFIFFAGE